VVNVGLQPVGFLAPPRGPMKTATWGDHNQQHLKEYNKQPYEEHKEHKKFMSKEWRDKNKELLSEKIRCGTCGCIVCRENMLRHTKTQKCKEFSVCLIDSDDDEQMKEVKNNALMALIGPIEMF
jgi:hypothetical protein